MSNVMITRLLTGEEILGDIQLNESENNCVIKNPTQVGAMPNPKTGNIDVHMAPFAPLSSQKDIKISLSCVLCQYEPVPDILDKYNKMFSSIILPKSSGLSL